MGVITKIVEIPEEFLKNPDSENFEVEVTFYFIEVDNGIGHYEFWGRHGYDSQPSIEIEDIEISDESNIKNVEAFKGWLEDVYFEEISIDVLGWL